MIRRFTEFIKIPESIRIRFIAGRIYNFSVWLDNISIRKEKLPQNPFNESKREKIITASLTSFPARINTVHLAIKSLMLQTVKPDRIVLWLSEDQFPDKKLPENLTELEKKGLEIKWTYNLYGHKKYFVPLMEQSSDELVITYDDDIIYPKNSIKKLIKKYKKYSECIVCNRTQALAYDESGNIKNPGRWDTISKLGLNSPSYKLCPSTGGGCLYPYGAIDLKLLDKNVIKNTALKGDDLWIMFVAAESGTPIIKTCKYHKSFSVVKDSQTEQLSTGNLINNEYMETLSKLIETFPKAWETILNKNVEGN